MTQRLLARLRLLSVLLVFVFASARAGAEDTTKEAAAHFHRGVAFFNEADYMAALVEFKRAYALAPNVNVLYNLGQTQYQQQKYADALATFEKYLAEGGVPHRADVEATVANLRTRVGRLELSTNVPDAEVVIDDEGVGKTPFAKPLTISVGRRKITVTAAGHVPVTRWIEIAAGETVRLPLTLDSQEVSRPNDRPQAPRDDSRGTLMTVGWVTTAVLATATVIVGSLAISSAGKLKDARQAFPADPSDVGSRASTVKALSVTADVLGIATVAAGGLSLYWTLSRSSSSEVKAGFSPTGVRLVGSF
jgi:tetratricopeptide (TPR) repeat protein